MGYDLINTGVGGLSSNVDYRYLNQDTPTVNTGSTTPASTAATSAANAGISYTPTFTNTSKSSSGYTTTTTTGGGALAQRPAIPPPPTAPDTGTLQNILSQTQRQGQIKKAMADYDALFAATQSSGFQAADNAGNTYASRLGQAGINPVASGVVTAQAKMGVYKQLGDITKEKDATRIDAVNKSQALQAQIAAQIASIKQAYSATLADYNIKSAGLDFDLNKFNAGQASETYKTNRGFDLQQNELNAKLLAMGLRPDGTPISGAGMGGGSGGGMPGGFNPGYSGDAGTPIQGATVGGVAMPHNVFVGWPTSWMGGPDTSGVGWGTGRTKGTSRAPLGI